MSRVTDYTTLTAALGDDELPIVDVHDTSMSASGTTKKVSLSVLSLAMNFSGLFGDGSDGAATLDGTATVGWASKSGSVYTMTRDVFSTGLTVNVGSTLIPAGYRIFCAGTFSNAGTVSSNGSAGNSGGGVASSSGSGTLGGGRSSGAGTVTLGNAGLVGSFNVGNAGTGGTGSAGNTGGAGGAPQTTSVSPLRMPWYVMTGIFPFSGTNNLLQGGCSGGGGGGDGTNKGASGGGGGGIIPIAAWSIVNTGTFSANGGNGVAPTVGVAGGGGGGCGGLVLGYSLAAWTPGTITVNAGTGGNGFGAGATAGTAGSAGFSLNVVLI